jgi:hypothetical protein
MSVLVCVCPWNICVFESVRVRMLWQRCDLMAALACGRVWVL